MGKQYLKVESLEPKKSLFLTVYDSINDCICFVANDDKGFYSADDMSCDSLKKLMKSDGVLMDIGNSHESEKALVVSVNNIVTLYFYLVNERYFSIDFNLSDFREKLISLGVIK